MSARDETVSEDLEAKRASMLDELHKLERVLSVASLSEVIRLLESERFEELTAAQIREVGEYRPIELGEERFFEKAWSRGKEVAAALGFAQQLGREAVRKDLVRLRSSLLGADETEGLESG
jgi:hypothetical protein